MKKHLFFSSLIFALLLLAGCQKSDEALPADSLDLETTAAVHAGDVPGNGLTARSGCVDGLECCITVTVNSGTPDFSICGVVSGDYSCTVEDPADCTTSGFGPDGKDFSSSPATFCVTMDRGFRITNNGSGTLNVDIDSDGTSAQGINIGSLSSIDYDVNSSCEVNECI